MAEHIIGSSAQYMMEVNNSGAVPVAGYSGGTVYPLLVDSSGKLEASTTIDNVGSPSFKTVASTASGIYTEVWALGGAGSRIEVHGWKVSTNFPGYVKIVTSGTVPTLISDYYLNYISGAVIEKTFSTPIVPGDADINIGFGTTVAGSTAVTIYGKEVE